MFSHGHPMDPDLSLTPSYGRLGSSTTTSQQETLPSEIETPGSSLESILPEDRSSLRSFVDSLSPTNFFHLLSLQDRINAGQLRVIMSKYAGSISILFRAIEKYDPRMDTLGSEFSDLELRNWEIFFMWQRPEIFRNDGMKEFFFLLREKMLEARAVHLLHPPV